MVLSEDKTTLIQIEPTDPSEKDGIVDIPEGIEIIAKDAGRGNFGIHSVNCPSTLKKICRDAFHDCRFLTEFYLSKPENLQSIEAHAFENCIELKSFPFERAFNLTEIGNWTFCNTGLIKVDFGAHGPCRVGGYAFSNCNSLVRANLGAQLRSIGESCFNNNKELKHVSLYSKEIERIEAFILKNCVNLETFACFSNPQIISDKSFYFVNIPCLITKNDTFLIPETNTPTIRNFLTIGNKKGE